MVYHLKATDLHIPKIASTTTNEVVALAKDDLKKTNKQTKNEKVKTKKTQNL